MEGRREIKWIEENGHKRDPRKKVGREDLSANTFLECKNDCDLCDATSSAFFTVPDAYANVIEQSVGKSAMVSEIKKSILPLQERCICHHHMFYFSSLFLRFLSVVM